MWPGSSSRRCSTARQNGSPQPNVSCSSLSLSGLMLPTVRVGEPRQSLLCGWGSRKRVSASRFGSLPHVGSTHVCRSLSGRMGLRSLRIGVGRRRSEFPFSRLRSDHRSDHRKVVLRYHHYGLSQAVDNRDSQLWITLGNRTKKVGLWSRKVGLQYREGGTTVPPSPSEPGINQSFRAKAHGNLFTTGTEISSATGEPYPTHPSSRKPNSPNAHGWLAVVATGIQQHMNRLEGARQ